MAQLTCDRAEIWLVYWIASQTVLTPTANGHNSHLETDDEYNGPKTSLLEAGREETTRRRVN